MKSPLFLVLGVLFLALIGATIGMTRFPKKAEVQPSPTPASTETASPAPTPSATPSAAATPTPTPTPAAEAPPLPIAEFKTRITKKNFGQYFTPETSPVQPERFTGYHTGVDVEYADVTTDVPIYAVMSGTVVRSERAAGYGGLLVIKGTLKGRTVYALYGHVRLSSLPKQGATVQEGKQVGVLGTGDSQETDGERKHLHFAVYAAEPLSILGYVQSQNELTKWIDPVSFY